MSGTFSMYLVIGIMGVAALLCVFAIVGRIRRFVATRRVRLGFYSRLLHPMFAAAVCFFALVSLALAADEVAVTTTGQVIADGIGALVPIAIALLTALCSLLLAALRRKYNLQGTAYLQTTIEQAAESVVQMAAEKAAAYAKETNAWPKGDTMLGWAIEALVSRIPKLTEDQADQYVHAALARIPGLGATGSAAYVPK